MNWGALESVYGSTVLTPRDPDLLKGRVHHSYLSVSSLVESSEVLIEGCSSDFAMVSFEYIAHAFITAVGHCTFVIVEKTVELGRVLIVVGVVLVIVKGYEVCSVIGPTESVVGERAPAEVNLHCPIGVLEEALNVVDVVCKLNGVAQNEGPRLAIVGDLGKLRPLSRARTADHLFADRNPNLGHCGYRADKAEEANICESVAALLAWLV